MRNRQIELGQGQARTEQIGCSSWRKGVGGLNPWPRPPCYRTPPHAQIFFRRGIPLIIFFRSKKSNGGALSSALQCKPSQALKCGATGGGCVLNGLPRICFQRQFGQTGGRYQGREGGLNLSRLVGQGPRSGPAHFREIRNYFFLRLQAAASRRTHRKRREIQGGGDG
jgi:hypothetical protein